MMSNIIEEFLFVTFSEILSLSQINNTSEFISLVFIYRSHLHLKYDIVYLIIDILNNVSCEIHKQYFSSQMNFLMLFSLFWIYLVYLKLVLKMEREIKSSL